MKKAYGKYVAALILFGSNGVYASQISLSSYQIVLLRTLLASVLLIAIFKLTRGKFTFLQNKRQFCNLAISGMAMGASWMFLYEAYTQLGVGVSSLAYACGPVIIMVLSPLLFKERLTGIKVACFIAVAAGAYLISAQGLQQDGSPWGFFCGGMSAVMYAVMIYFNKKAIAIRGLENASLQLVFAFLIVAIFVGFRQGFAMQIANDDWLPILMLGLVNTAIGCYLYFSAIGKLSGQTVAIVGYLEPLSSVIFAVALLNETLLPLQALGGLLILGGALASEILGSRAGTEIGSKSEPGQEPS